ncbi:MAG: LapA family protein [Gammaproteobacteria bacterium]
MFRTILILALLVVFLLIAITFAWLNPGPIGIDVAFHSFETSKSVAFAVCFAAGWLFGLLCCSGYILGLLNQRRRLNRAVRLAESEVSNLRSLPLDPNAG